MSELKNIEVHQWNDMHTLKRMAQAVCKVCGWRSREFVVDFKTDTAIRNDIAKHLEVCNAQNKTAGSHGTEA